MTSPTLESSPVAYFLAHDDDVARALETLAEDAAAAPDGAEAVDELPVEQLELWAEVYAPN